MIAISPIVHSYAVYEHAHLVDPTRTTVLRNAFADAMEKRFNAFKRIIKRAVADEDCFGLTNRIYVHDMYSPGNAAFAFPKSSDKLSMFEDWLQQQIDAGILSVTDMQQIGNGIEGAWTNRYILDSYKRGLMRGRYELQRAGADVPSIEQSGGIFAMLNAPVSVDRVGLLYTRTFSELTGITAAMDQQISRILAQGLADGDGPILLAEKMLSAIDGTGMGTLAITDTLGRFIPAARRAEMLARTEIIRAHHLATIQEYRNWNVHDVHVQAEWQTAGDDRVCPKCESMQGKIFTLDEIEKLIPAHPLCRCCALPYLPN
jgi:SPP1 gp7 family putative phage head morphogenesis protein